MSEKKGRVLCVDDEPHVLRALQWLLQKDFEVHTATNASDALRLVQRIDFDVVVSDQRMPVVTGVELLREIRRTAPRTMRILLTGYSDLDAMVRSVNESEVFRFITKPWDIRALPKLIGEAAEIARAEIPLAPDPTEIAATLLAAPAAAVAHERAQPAVPKQDVTTVAVHQSESILVIDDDAVVHDAITREVGNVAHLRHAFNLAEAVRMLSEAPVSVLVSEIAVNRMDATRLVRLMKQKYPHVVSVVFSRQKDAAAVMALINEGQVYRFIPKPFKPGFIRLVVGAALKRHRMLRESPALQRRYSAEASAKATVESLLSDVARTAAEAPQARAPAAAPAVAAAMAGAGVANPAAPGDTSDGLSGRITGVFRRLFGV